MPNKRKYISTEYGLVNLRDGDQIIHLDPEFLAELYWDIQDGKIAEVVRCKDCKYADWWGPKGREVLDCTRLCVPHVTPDWYCAWGERKEDVDIS